jgi:hypothetical protein
VERSILKRTYIVWKEKEAYSINMLGSRFSTEKREDTSTGTYIKYDFVLEEKGVLVDDILVCFCADYIL